MDIRFMNSSRDYMAATFGQHQQPTYMMPRSGDHINNEGSLVVCFQNQLSMVHDIACSSFNCCNFL